MFTKRLLKNICLVRGETLKKISSSGADWMLVDCALHAYSMVSVPLYDTLGHEAVRYILTHAELQAIACSLAVLPTLLQCLPDCPNVKTVVGAHIQGSRLLYKSPLLSPTALSPTALSEPLLEETVMHCLDTGVISSGSSACISFSSMRSMCWSGHSTYRHAPLQEASAVASPMMPYMFEMQHGLETWHAECILRHQQAMC